MIQNNHKRVAFYHTGIGDSVGGGGAGRFFIDLYDAIYKHAIIDTRLYFVTDPLSYSNFVDSGFFSTTIARNRFFSLIQVNNRLKHVLESLNFITTLIHKRISLIHICQYYWQDHDHRIKSLRFLPKSIRPKVVVNFVHCNFPYEYFDRKHPHSEIFHKRFDVMFKHLKIDAVFSWYELFCEFVKENKLFAHEPILYPIKHYCCNTDKFKPSNKKENIIVFASRLDDQKNPMMFLEAIKKLASQHNELIMGWRFLLCGNGPLKDKVSEYIFKNKIEKQIKLLTNVSDMSAIFGISKCYVSTQFFENFTSLSMHEAMAAGNAIIARNVGQTSYYVKDSYNGYLLEEDTPDGLTKKLARFICEETEHDRLMNNSIKMVNEVHSRENFVKELDEFWTKLLN